MLGVWPWERRGSILEPPELAQIAKVVILLKLSVILMNFGPPQERVGGRRVAHEWLESSRSAAEAAAPILYSVLDLRPTVYLCNCHLRFVCLHTAPTHLKGARPDLKAYATAADLLRFKDLKILRFKDSTIQILEKPY